jgi:hypothetical protein
MKGKHYHLYRRQYKSLFTLRGKRLKSFRLYKDLKAHAVKLTVAAGYPKSAVWDLYDWAQG